MIARGKNASDLFPAVVKNVACKNIEVSAPREGSPLSTSRSKLELVGDEKGDIPVPGGPICSECPWSRKRHLPDVPEPDVDQHDGARVPWMLSLWSAATGVKTSLRAGAPVPAEKPPLPQVKKLVYVYLVRYAEEQQDLALLSISTFQRGLKVRGLHLPLWGLGLDGAVLEV